MWQNPLAFLNLLRRSACDPSLAFRALKILYSAVWIEARLCGSRTGFGCFSFRLAGPEVTLP